MYTQEKLQKLLNSLGGEIVDDSAAHDIAEGLLFEEEGLKEYLQSKGIKDPLGFLANRI